MKRIAVALSGGVDSLRAAALLQEMGHEVLGLHMRLLPSSPGGQWAAERTLEAREAALRSLASRFGIAMTVIDCRAVFEKLVIQPFLEAYRDGLTPNPCVQCNPRVKFTLILREALNRGVDAIATGHYARVSGPGGPTGRFQLLRGLDAGKDQSYFLFGLTQEQLSRTLFPLGTSNKLETFLWARSVGLEQEIPRESQEICFIPQGGYQQFLLERHPEDPAVLRGPIVDQEGRVVGEHRGLFAYTVGQRRGLGVSSSAPLYVTELDVPNNALRVGRAQDLDRRAFTAASLNWVSIEPPRAALRCSVKIRQQHQPSSALVTPFPGGRVRVVFDIPQRAVTPGQAAVFYDGDVLLGGGIIQRSETMRGRAQSSRSQP